MGKVRRGVAAVLAVATLSMGGVACTPQQQTEFGTALGRLITFILFINVYGDPGATATTVPTTLPPPAG